MRVEDIDPPREQSGATQGILRTLEAYGFEWHGAVRFQSASRDQHHAAIQALLERRQAYFCSCSRSDLASADLGDLGPVYPGTCRTGAATGATAVRVRTDNAPLSYIDGLQGLQVQHLESDSGDFIIRRKDELVAYHLAVVVDDYDQGITDVVRGIDLMNSTPRQIWLQQLLGYTTPNYSHIPIAINALGQKLSKRAGAGAVLSEHAVATLLAVLVALGQEPPAGLSAASLHTLWDWAFAHWNMDRLQGKTELQVGSIGVARAESGFSGEAVAREKNP